MSDIDIESSRDRWLRRVAAIRRHQQDGVRAPHKPLLLLYSIGRLHRGLGEAIAYKDAEPELQYLLDEYGPPRATTPSYPFRRLANDDGLWVLSTATNDDPGDSAGRLRDLDAAGALAPDFRAALRTDPRLLVEIVRMLLEENWPETLHAEIAASVGLDLDAMESRLVRARVESDPTLRRRRDPSFRSNVLLAYEYRCAFCGYDGRLGTAAVGLDAAHVRWWAFDGPDTVDNGVCLCTLHHRLLDLGVLGISKRREVVVSKHFIGHSQTARQLVLDLVGRPVTDPQPGDEPPAVEHVSWHSTQVFRLPARGTLI